VTKPLSEYDVIILGGGCAGLSLVLRLLEKQLDLCILILEQRKKYQHDRTWAGWFSQDELRPFNAIADRKYHRWSFSHTDTEHLHTSAQQPYFALHSGTWYEHVLQQIDAAPNVTLRLGETISAEAVLQQVHQSTLVFDSTHASAQRNCPQRGLWQSFVGVNVSSDNVLFTSEQAKQAYLMHDMQVTEYGFAFMYCLPQGSHQALCEVTLFTQRDVSRAVLQSLTETWTAHFFNTQLKQPDVALNMQVTEYAHLPMWCDPVPTPLAPNHFYMGVAGGAMRASSGYAFGTIQRWASSLSQLLAQSEYCHQQIHHDLRALRKLKSGRYSWFQRWMDSIYLEVLVNNASVTPTCFMQIAKHLTGDEFARFMSHRATLTIWTKVILALPKWIFIKAMIKVCFK
jgi:lycopene beta-cyclase